MTTANMLEPIWLDRNTERDESRLNLIAVNYTLDLDAFEFNDSNTKATYKKVYLSDRVNILCDRDIWMTQQGFEAYKNALRQFLFFQVRDANLRLIAFTAHQTVLQLASDLQAEIGDGSDMNPCPGKRFVCVINKEPLFHLYRH